MDSRVMVVLAMTQLTSWLGLACFAICLSLIVHALVPFSGKDRERVKPRLGSLFWRAGLECLSLFIWLACALPLLAWGFWIGDNEHWFYDFAWLFAAGAAFSVTGVATLRTYLAGTTSRYLRLHLWIPVVLVFLFVGLYGYESLRLIEGFTEDSAAQEVFDRMSAHIDEPVRLVEVGPAGSEFAPDRCRAYRIMGADEPRGRFIVCRHKWIGWTVASSERFPPSEVELDRAKQWLAGSTNRQGAISILHSITKMYPYTPADTEARELLESIGEPVP